MASLIGEILQSTVGFWLFVGFVIWLIIRSSDSKKRDKEFSSRLAALEAEVAKLKMDGRTAVQPEPKPIAQAAVPASVPPPAETIPSAPPPEPEPITEPESFVETAAEHSVPTVENVPTASRRVQTETHPEDLQQQPPPTAEPSFSPEPYSDAQPQPATSINWEQFLGVKGFAYAAGLSFFLFIAFAIKYSFDNDLISPELRMAGGFLAGIGLLIGGTSIHTRKQYRVGAQTLCATGVVILYAVTFACRSIYHFEFFGLIPTFLLMALITTAAFLLAVRLDAMVVAILGILGGFLSPLLLSTGEDNPFGLFVYIAILDAGLIVVALNRHWYFLTALAALGTVIMQIGWAIEFFVDEDYAIGNKTLIPLAVLLGFNLLYLAATWFAKQRDLSDKWLSHSTLGLAAVALAFTAWFLHFPSLAERPWLIFGFVFLIDSVATATILVDEENAAAQPIFGLAVFGLLAGWTTTTLSESFLNAALTFYLIFAIVHSIFPFWLQRRHGLTNILWTSLLFAPLALLLVLIPIFTLEDLSFIVWPFVLLVDLLAIVLAMLLVSLIPVLTVMLLTLVATAALIFRIPATLTGLPTSFFLLAAFIVFFVVVSVWVVRKLKPEIIDRATSMETGFLYQRNLAAILPGCAAILPFLLLILATLRLRLADPSPVFGLALLLVVLLMGITKLFMQQWLPLIGLACVFALEYGWHFSTFVAVNISERPNAALLWYIAFFILFALYPFLFLKQFRDRTVVWATSALAGLPQFFLVYKLVDAAYPNDVMGLLPAAFAIPSLTGLTVVLKRVPAENPVRMTQLAWFGGVALCFITLIFPVQLERQWITIGWALEGVALLWLFHRVSHPGLRLVAVGLLVTAFVRLALNPSVLDYHTRSAIPILNWYLYTYGIVTVGLFAGSRLLAPPRNLISNVNAPPLLTGMSTVLAFLLLNIEIADYFSEAGSTLTFQFSGNFARDMTYSIAWALFALALLVIGIIRKIPAARYCATGLLIVTLIKLFFHDLTRLDQLYRIGAFFGVAVIAMLASFAYQRFYAAASKE